MILIVVDIDIKWAHIQMIENERTREINNEDIESGGRKELSCCCYC
jgi:hypothetical protein